ncbi:MAG: PIN domain-containing protein [Solirubrobacterales bacterium]|nr:PIN domain-containing protein [Solirubrobacterales bacterium]
MAGLIVDTSALLAFFDSSEPDHDAVTRFLETEPGPFIVSPFVIAELDYLVATRYGVQVELDVLDALASGAWELPAVDAKELSRIHDLIGSYRDQNVGVAEASNVLLADRYGTRDILTLDRGHFEKLRPLGSGHFTVHPRDPA